MSVVIETTIGDITVDLYLNERPRTCLNFLKLCKVKYYNFCVFHKIQRNFIAQTGDPIGTGRGGESIFSELYGDQAKYFDMEIKPKLKHKKLGTLSMVNNGNNMNGSQFFITLSEELPYLDDVHTVFGEVSEGFDILIKLNDTICNNENHPYQDIRITHTVVLHDPYDDPANLVIPPLSPIPTKAILASNYVGADEEIDDTKGRTVEEIEEEIRNKEAKARATILEMVGDIPDADVKPPDNVLFVCKLNPVTTADDLEIIFSRFGSIVSCEVIKDKKTDESLQYAFIEFENEQDCENAYFKMDNVLIDDRRIHVDFSQSVSKLKWEENRNPSVGNRNKKQQYVLKDTTRKAQGSYDMIFEPFDEDLPSPSKEKRNKTSGSKEKIFMRRKKSLSPESQKSMPAKHDSIHKSKSPVYKSKKHESRSPSPPPKIRKHKSRSPSPAYKSKKHKFRSPSSSFKVRKHKSRSPSPAYKSRKHKSRSPSPAFKHRKHESRCISPPYKNRRHKSRSPSPGYKDRKQKLKSQSPVHKSKSHKSRSPSPPYKNRKHQSRSPSSKSNNRKGRSRKHESRSSSPDYRRQKNESRSPEYKKKKYKSRSPNSEYRGRKHKSRSPNYKKQKSVNSKKQRRDSSSS